VSTLPKARKSFSTALTQAISEQHNRQIGYHIPIPGYEEPSSRDLVAASNVNIRLAVDVFGESGLLDHFYKREELLDFGTFDNCREYGVTVSVGGWTFAVYEHRNSDNICIEGCPTDQVKEYGPYGTDDKYDVLFEADYSGQYTARAAMVAIADYVLDTPTATREQVKRAAETVEVSA
jgi:hypothetical protein